MKIHSQQKFRMGWSEYIRCRAFELHKSEKSRHLQYQERNSLQHSIG